MNKNRSLSFLPRPDRPREKLLAKGPEALSQTELLAILLGTGVKGSDVLQIAHGVVKRFGSKSLAGLDHKALSAQKGIGNVRACVVVAAIELGRRLFVQDDELIPAIDGPESVYRLTRDLSFHKKEHFVGLYLNAKNQILRRETISIGSLFANMVHPREVFAPALEVRAAAMVLIHNHPSGDPEPSPEDRALTRRLVEAGQLMGIEVLDHLIVGRKGYVSFQEKRFL